MAIIPRAQRSTLPNAAPLQAVDVNADAIGRAQTQLGQGLSDLGEGVRRGVSAYAETAQKERDDLDDFQTKIALTRFHGDQEVRQRDYDNAIAGDGRDHTTNRLVAYDADRKALIDSLPNNPKQREYALLQTEAWRADYGAKSYAKQREHLDTYKSNELLTLFDGQLSPMITGDPATALAAISQVDTMLAGTDLPDASKAAVRKAVGAASFRAWFAQSGADADEQADAIIAGFGDKLPSGGAPDASTGTASDRGLEFIRKQESFAPVAYRDYRQYSVGYGTKGQPGERITREEAERRLREETSRVDEYIRANVTVPLTQNQHDALVSFGFNLGTDDIEKLLPDINAGKFDRVAQRMLSFNRAGGVPLSGLIERRRAEAAMFRDQTPSVVGVEPTAEGQFVRWLVHNKPQIIARATKLREQIADQEFVRGAVEGAAAFDPFNDEQRKKVDNAFAKAEISTRLFAGDEAAMQRAVEISQRLNYVPEALTQSIFGLVSQNDAGKRATGYRAAAAILAKRPYAFDAVPSGGTLRKDAEDYTALVGGGLAPQEAIARLDEMKSPEWKKAETERKKDTDGQRGIVDNLTPADFVSSFDDSFLGLGRNPALAAMGPEAPVAMADYRELVRENYIRHGDENLAKRLAVGQMKRLWGVSTVNGNKYVTRYPIERAYPQVGGSSEYIGEQLAAEVKEATGKDVPLENIEPRADDQTQREIASGRPTYVVMFKDPETGLPQRLPGRWYPNVEKAEGAMGAKFEPDAAGRTKAVAGEADREAGREAAKLPAKLLRQGGEALLRWFLRPAEAR